MNRRIVWMAVTVFTSAACISVFAWREAGHCGIGRAMFAKKFPFRLQVTGKINTITFSAIPPASPSERLKCGQMNFPDMWDPNSGTRISNEFTWTHDVLRNGNVLWVLPNEPVYANPTREPGMMMGRLLPKVANWTTQQKPSQAEREAAKNLAVATALGFARHNAQDRVVHFSYFIAGGIDEWFIQHQAKEKWADCMLLGAPNCFNVQGKLSTFYETSVPVNGGYFIPISGNAKIIHLAQKVARKNRQFMDVGKVDSHWTHVESCAEIDARIATMRTKMMNDMRGYELYEVFKDLNEKATFYGWDVSDVLLKVKAGVSTANSEKISAP